MKKRRGNSNNDYSLLMGIVIAFGGLIFAAWVCMMFNIEDPSKLLALFLWFIGSTIIYKIMDWILYTNK